MLAKIKFLQAIAIVIFLFFTGNINAQINGNLFFKLGNDTTVTGCDSVCMTIRPTFTNLKKTSSYSISNVAYASYPLPAFTGTTVLNLFDDQYTAPLNLGWNFCMYGQSFNKFIIGSNGIFSFDLSYANGQCYYSTYGIPDIDFPAYSMFFPFQDIDPSVGTTQGIKYQVTGVAPNRKLVVSVNSPLWGSACTGFPVQKQQLVLHEGTNIIDMIIYTKSSCSGWQSGVATQGLQETSLTGLPVPGRNNTAWTASNEVKRFTPNGATEIKSINWYDINGTLLASNVDTFNLCIKTFPRKVIGRITYTTCSGTFTLRDTMVINGSLLPKPTIKVDSIKNINCLTANSGKIAVTGQGTSAPYSYSINNGAFQSSGIFSNLPIGTYLIKVKGNNGCTKDTSITLVKMTPPKIDSIKIVKAKCGLANGSVQIYASSAYLPLSYAKGTGTYSTVSTFTGLATGTYTFHVKNSGSCIKDTTFLVPQDVLPKVTNVVKTNILCNGISSGSISVTGSGILPISYALGTGSYSTTSTFTGLSSGNHTIHVKDGNGCIKDTVINLTSPTVLKFASIIIDSVNCNGGANGKITVNASGGTPTYTYALGNGTYSANNIFSGLSTGNYVVHIKDANNCIKDTTVSIASPTALKAGTLIIDSVKCKGGNDGKIIVIGTGGIPSYTYSIGSSPYSSSNSYSGFSAGTYTVHIKDANNCIFDTTINIYEPNALLINSLVVDSAKCKGSADGKITVTGIGGSPAYIYAIGTGAYSGSNVFTGLVAGTYSVHIKDSKNCQRDTSVVVSEPAGIVVDSITAIKPACNQSNGTIKIYASNGYAPYTYALGTGAFSAANTFTGLASGIYTIHIKDNHNCTKDSVFILNSDLLPTISALQITPNICNGASTGMVTVTGSGTPAFTYSIGTGNYSSSNVFSGLSAGNYALHIKDGNGCIKDTLITITEPSKIQVASIMIDSIKCKGDTDGKITILGSGGTPPYTYAIASGSYSSTNIFTGLSAGSYTIHIKDSNGCVNDTNVNITEPVMLQVSSLTIDSANCNGSADGMIILLGSGGTPAYTYALGTGGYSIMNTFTGLSSGVYILHIKDDKNCILDTSVTIAEPSEIVLDSVAVIKPTCSQSNGTINLFVNGGSAPYTYALGTGNYSTVNSFTGLPAGTYTIHIKDGNNCTKDSIYTLVEEQLPTVSSLQISPSLCYGGSSGTITVNGSGILPFSYALGSGNYSTNNSFTGLSAGTYTIHLKDGNGCTVDTTALVTEPLALQIDSADLQDVNCYNQNDGGITIYASGGVLPLSYAIGSGSYTNSNIFTGLVADTFTIFVKDINGCIKDTTLIISEPTALQVASLTIDSTMCQGSADGEIIIIGTGGTPLYTYAINSGSYSSTNIFTGLTSGTYNLNIKDSKNCQLDTSVTIYEPSSIIIDSISSVKPTCNQANGSIQVYSSGGSAPFTYALGTGAYSSINTFTGLSSGTYTLHIKDNHNCIKDSLYVLIGEQLPSISSLQITSNLCFGGSSGSITVNATGIPPINYALGVSSYSTINTFTGLIAGSYVIHISDSNGCILDSTVSITAPTALKVASIIIDSINCEGSSDGKITITGTGGTPTYTYALGTGTYSTTNTFTGLSAGTYTVHIKDDNGCIKDTNVSITEPTMLQVSSLVADSVECNGGGDGMITITGTGGTPTYTYALGTGTYSTTNTFTGLSAGTYTIHINDIKNCQRDTTVIIYEPSGIVIDSITSIKPTCNQTNGSIQVYASGGSAPYTYALGTGAYSTANTFTGLSSGTYTIHIKDNHNCIKDSVFILTADQLPTVSSLQTTSNLCYGTSTGSITVTGSGVATITYALGTGTYSTTNTFTGLSAGTYIVHIKDGNGCISDTLVTVTEPQSLQIDSVLLQDISCNGLSDGKVTINVSGGTPDYSFTLGTGMYSNSNMFSNLAVGSHTIHIKDSMNCQHDTTIIINQPSSLIVDSIIQIKPTCNQANGSIQIFSSGGSAPYTYALGTGTFSSLNTFTGLASGNYTIHIKDNNNCTKDSNVVLTSDQLPIVTSLLINPNLCFGTSNGSISIIGSGSGTLTYSIDNNPYDTTGIFTGLSSGTYILHLKDGAGCITDTSVVVTQPNALDFDSLLIENVSCFGQSNGSITIIMDGGTPAYSYAIGNGNFSTINTFTGLSSGNYSIHIKDMNSCTLDTILTLVEPSQFIFDSISTVDANCYGVPGGSISVNVQGGTPAFTYAIGSGPYGASNTFIGLLANNYLIHAKDSKGCQIDTTIAISHPAPIVIDSITIDDITCHNGNDGNIALYVQGGTPGYQFSMGSGAYGASSIFANLSAGTYIFHIRDSFLCNIDTAITLLEPNNIQINTVISPVLCYGGSTGSITATTTQGISPYSYSINGGASQANGTFSNLPSDTFLISVKDANGCEQDTTVFVPEQQPIHLNLNLVNINCFGDSTGSITIAASAGQAPYQYSLNGSAFSGLNNFTLLPAGTYIISVKDNNDCIHDTTITLTQKAKINATNQVVNTSCYGMNDGSITVIASGGTPNYMYSINGGISGTNNTISGLTSGSYTVTVSDALNCSRNFTAIVNQPSKIEGKVLVQNPKCKTLKFGTITINANGGSPGYTYALNGGSFVNYNQFTSLDTGTYTIQIKDSKGCTFDTTVNIKNPENPIFNEIIFQEPKCHGDINGSITVSMVGSSPFMYSIVGIIPSQSSSTLSPLGVGTYTISVEDANECEKDSTVILTEPDEMKVSLEAEIENCFTPEIDGMITVNVEGGRSPYSYSWIGSNSITSVASGLNVGNYQVTVSDANECQVTTSAEVIQDNCCKPFFPTAFSPNGDNLNETFQLANLDEAESVQFEIFNRYGQRVFLGINSNAIWDGTFNGKDCDMGIYFVKVTYLCRGWQGHKLVYTGEVTLMR